jgi:transposase InsO family protein
VVNHKRVERLWRQESLKVPLKHPKRKRLWLADGSCVRLRPSYKAHVWSYDFVADWTSDGRAIRMLTLIDEHTRECLAIDVARSLKSEDVLERLSDLFVRRGVPTRCWRRRSSSNAGGGTSTKSDRTVRWAIGFRRRERFSLLRLRLSKRSRLALGMPNSNLTIGSLAGGRSLASRSVCPWENCL